MNVVCTGDGSFVEVQGTAEREPFGRALLDELLDLAVGWLRRADQAPAGCARRMTQRTAGRLRRGSSWPPRTSTSSPS